MPGISAQFVLLTLHLEVAWVYKYESLSVYTYKEEIIMSLTDEEKYIIKSSFAQLTTESVNFSECFYKKLFEMAPLIEPLFKSDHEILENTFTN
jgi:hypothetical protein